LITQLLNRQFVLDQLVEIEEGLQHLADTARREALPPAARALAQENFALALEQLRLARKREEGRIFAARRRLLRLHDVPGVLVAPSSVILQRLWGLDFRVRMAALEELLRGGDPSSESTRASLERLRWILSQREEDLDIHLTAIQGVTPTEVEPPAITLSDYQLEERALQEGLTSLERADLPRAFRLLANARTLNARRLDAINAAKRGDRSAMRMLVPPNLAEQRKAIEGTTWRARMVVTPRLAALGEAFDGLSAMIERKGLDALPDVPGVSWTYPRQERRDSESSGPESALPAAAPSRGPEKRAYRADRPRARARTRTRGTSEVTSETSTIAVRRVPHMNLSATLPIAPGTEFRVEIYADLQGPRAGEESEDILAKLPDQVLRFRVRADLLTSQHFVVLGESTATLQIDRREDRSSTASFNVRVQDEETLQALAGELLSGAEGTITAVFTFSGRPCGRVSRMVPLELRTPIPDAPGARQSPTGRVRASVLPPPCPLAGRRATVRFRSKPAQGTTL